MFYLRQSYQQVVLFLQSLFIVDFFYKHLPIERKQRTHFHSFMKSVHDQIRTLGNIEDPLKQVAKNIAENTQILCLDEMHVNDITDAMLLGGLFKHLFENGVTLITTSNIKPSDLYKDGLQRKRFLPAIKLLEKHTSVMNSDGEMDYRMRALETANVYQIGSDETVQAELNKYFLKMVGKDAVILKDPVAINTRTIPVRQRCKAVAWFESAKIVGYKLQDVTGSQYEGGYDKILVESSGNVMWGRFYDLDTNVPFFCSRDGIKKSTIAEISHERRNGYAWYGNWPASLIANDYPSWKTKHGI